jgi:LAO/AO transport system kinase
MALHEKLAAAVLRGEPRAVARACRIVDERWPGHTHLLQTLYPRTKGSWFIGVTGSPGVGKSTLVSRLVQHLRAEGKRVGVVAVDPSSPFSGGAILGDRVRMQVHWADPEVFIRSVATRGAVGGLSRSTADVARVLAAWGAHVVLVETVGVGQDELDILNMAHSTLVVQAPGAGDDVQAAKAGVMECADVFAVNKADLPGADATVQISRSMLALGQALTRKPVPVGGHSLGAHLPAVPVNDEGTWDVPVVACVASRDEGIAELLAELARHRRWLMDTPLGHAQSSRRLREELMALIRDALSATLLERYREEIERAAERIAIDEADPYGASRSLVERWLQAPAK